MKGTVNKKINFKFYYEGKEESTIKRSRAGTHTHGGVKGEKKPP